MTQGERLFHAVAFELLALAIIVPATSLMIGKGASALAIVGIGLSIFTIIWNYIYNQYFDQWFGENRAERGLKMRLLHTLGFEGGLIFITIPVISWFLSISLLQALLLEAGFLLFFLFYATGFNWFYDRVQPYQRVNALFSR
ncbi:TPA: PACE efflux transporter [Vibrio vulnificus]|uniref:PACE efflux transporter n=1 Tax=Vibrio vulnificus TaxID=672 RepID=UPI001A3288DC|nr:PACE efflux transporter [Vibrio vulnificus]HAS6270819.1 PACE efflux transporter [Vibrio vulnificus]HDY7427158.1 PACE efflux transporter [Vibrio vulnificus]